MIRRTQPAIQHPQNKNPVKGWRGVTIKFSLLFDTQLKFHCHITQSVLVQVHIITQFCLIDLQHPTSKMHNVGKTNADSATHKGCARNLSI
jgi:hypothetical protein